MCLQNAVDKKCRVAYSLRDLRTAKGLTQRQIADVLVISKSLYHSIECGARKPSIDTLFRLSAIYRTSMDFIYHAFYRQHHIWNYPDHDLQYALREAAQIDIMYLRDRAGPLPPPKLLEAYIFERTEDAAEIGTRVYDD